MLGLYVFQGVSDPKAVKADPRWARLAAASDAWEMYPIDGDIRVCIAGHRALVEDYDQPIICSDGLIWHPPQQLPHLYDLARDQIPPAASVTLRRWGRVQVPWGLGPVYGCGRKRGQPSTDFGQLLIDLMQRASDEDHTWGAEEVALTEDVIFAGFAQVYTLTRELWDELSPYDGDEVEIIIEAMQGLDPKASGGGAPTSPPSPPES